MSSPCGHLLQQTLSPFLTMPALPTLRGQVDPAGAPDPLFTEGAVCAASHEPVCAPDASATCPLGRSCSAGVVASPWPCSA